MAGNKIVYKTARIFVTLVYFFILYTPLCISQDTRQAGIRN